MRWLKKVIWAALFLAFSCGGEEGPGLTTDGTYVPPDKDAATDDPIDVGDVVKATQNSVWVDTARGKLYAEAYTPADCTAAEPCPLLVLVPDGLEGNGQFDCCAKALAETLHAVVVTYNPPGRGVAGEVSEGEEDFGGNAAQDALKDVANHFEKRSEVLGENAGFISFGLGLTDAAGALARFHATSLYFVHYLIDIEGPPNRCFVSQHPFWVDPEDPDFYINEDGGDVTTTRCDFDIFPRMSVFPPGTSSDGKGENGTPNSYICNANAPVLHAAGVGCGDDNWWKEREARIYLKTLPVHYLRLQFLHDHRQPTRYNAREALYWVSQSDAASYQLNNVNLNESFKGVAESDLEAAGAYLNPSTGNGFGDATYDDNGDFKQLTMGELMVGVLPGFIKKMQSRAAE